MLLIGVVVGKPSKGVPIAYVLVAVIVLTCEVSWYWWDYREFRTQVGEKAAAAQMADAATALDDSLVAETGSPGFWGYLKWSALRGATIEESKVAGGTGAGIVNWGKRLLSLFWALVWAFIGLDNA
jgi:hypothetical protein